MFVFINPTARNISTRVEWEGPRFPFIGTKHIWRVFHKAGLFDTDLLAHIEREREWSLQLTDRVLDFLKLRGFYLTNLVKWAGHDSTLPDARKIQMFLPILRKEIELVRPRTIVTFGHIPFVALVGRRITLSDFYYRVMKVRRLEAFPLPFNPQVKVVPCYFPIGRGKPGRAVDLLRMLVRSQDKISPTARPLLTH